MNYDSFLNTLMFLGSAPDSVFTIHEFRQKTRSLNVPDTTSVRWQSLLEKNGIITYYPAKKIFTYNGFKEKQQ